MLAKLNASRFALIGWCWVLMGLTHDGLAHSWMHPDEYFGCPGYFNFMAQCDSTEGWIRAVLNTQMPDGQLVRLEALRSNEEDGFFVHCDADMRWVVHSTNPRQNLSESLVQGFNGGSLDFVMDGHIHSMGGYGLWRRHFDLIRFHGGPQAWQLVAPNGDVPQIRDVDHTQAFYADGKAIVFVDNVAAEGGYDASNYILYELDVVSRHWQRLGLVDARIGMFQEVHALKYGALVLNRAGELVWLDFKSNAAKLLMNRAEAFSAFRDWRSEVGRITFHSDSSLWHEVGKERFQFAIPWSELAEVESFPMVSSNSVAKASLPATSANAKAATHPLRWAFGVIIALGSLCVLAVVLHRVVPRAQPANPADAGQEGEVLKGALSPLARKLVALQGQQFETEALDEVLDIAHISSPETLRSQRARLLQRVNTEYRVKEGVDLVVRKQSPNDRRRSVYCIGVAFQS